VIIRAFVLTFLMALVLAPTASAATTITLLEQPTTVQPVDTDGDGVPDQIAFLATLSGDRSGRAAGVVTLGDPARITEVLQLSDGTIAVANAPFDQAARAAGQPVTVPFTGLSGAYRGVRGQLTNTLDPATGTSTIVLVF
jgi:hypothetical protein